MFPFTSELRQKCPHVILEVPTKYSDKKKNMGLYRLKR